MGYLSRIPKVTPSRPYFRRETVMDGFKEYRILPINHPVTFGYPSNPERITVIRTQILIDNTECLVLIVGIYIRDTRCRRGIPAAQHEIVHQTVRGKTDLAEQDIVNETFKIDIFPICLFHAHPARDTVRRPSQESFQETDTVIRVRIGRVYLPFGRIVVAVCPERAGMIGLGKKMPRV